jgi:hypothetical protein
LEDSVGHDGPQFGIRFKQALNFEEVFAALGAASAGVGNRPNLAWRNIFDGCSWQT